MKSEGDNEQVFKQIFNENKWGDADSKSGPGSNFLQTEVLRKKLPDFLSKHHLKTMLDIPCGDFYWMKEIKMKLNEIIDRYTGGDIVNELVTANNIKYGDAKFNFAVLDITSSSLPKADIVLCRDCLLHLSYRDIFKAIRLIRQSGSTYFLTTSFTGNRVNKNVATGGWRPLNFQKFPFYFPKPTDVLVEECTENGGIYQDKSLVLWKISKLNLSFFTAFLFVARVKNLLK